MAPTSADETPDVTVVIVVHNDAERLPRAVRSAQGQTLQSLEILIVDDASTDTTELVASALAAADHRIRYHRLPANSGAAGRPRNIGVELSRGRYVIFLDSDDELDTTACQVLLAAALDTGADIVAGRCVRIEVAAGGRVDPWFNWLYRSRQLYGSIDDKPDLLFDTNSTNKLYPLEFLRRTGLRFPEGRFYEDLEFITKAYVLARGIAIVPNRVYLWYIYRDTFNDGATRLSVTQSRRELKNFTDRLAVHRDLDVFLAEHASPGVRLHKDVKFLKIDMKLCVQDIPHLEETLAQRLLDELGEYLDSIHPGALEQVDPMLRAAAYLVRQRDLAGVVSVADYLYHGGKLSRRLHVEGGRAYWGSDHLDTPGGRAALDVTALDLHSRPFQRMELFTVVDKLRIDGTRMVLEGTVLNQLGLVPADADVSMQLVVSAGARARPVVAGPACAVDRRDGDIAWRADLDLRPLSRRTGLLRREWAVRACLFVDGQRSISRLSIRDRGFGALALPVRPLVRGFAADHLETSVTPEADLALRLVGTGPGARAADRARLIVSRARTTRMFGTLRRRLRKAVGIAARAGR